ncbi:MAG: 5'-nucleotidase [Lachnospiraceae bacterium]|jgi:5'-nucleotidase|nr:5'-nucleotidase [Lachnospiraceae bacterium]
MSTNILRSRSSDEYQTDEYRLVVGISSRALFDLTHENTIFETEGVEAYCRYQIEHENDVLPPGSGFALVKALLNLNTLCGEERVEVVIMSQNSPDTSLRVFNSITHYGLDITRAVLVSGASLSPYLEAFRTDLFLSADEADVQSAIDAGIAAGIIYCGCAHEYRQGDYSPIRIAFDGDAVLFSDEAEAIFRRSGLKAFSENEHRHALRPLSAGPFARFLKIISDLQSEFPAESSPIRTALVTARCVPAHERVIRTLRAWNVRIDEVFFLGGIDKQAILKAFAPHIFFDDQEIWTIPAARFVPAARVPYRHIA